MVACALGLTSGAQAQDAAALKQRHAELRPALLDNDFGRPLAIESSESTGGLQGDIFARLDQGFAAVGPALALGPNWCDILLLQFNVKQCRITGSAANSVMSLQVGNKRDNPLVKDHQLDFSFRVVTSRPDYLKVLMTADQGPMGTSNYRIVLEVVALDKASSFLHLSYAYDYGMAARLAMQGYLATAGRGKVGFSVLGRSNDGKPRYVGQLRGVIERNTMRYYLAIEAFLDTLAVPPAQRFERRLLSWFNSVERYPLQLHELERDEYLELKKRQAESE